MKNLSVITGPAIPGKTGTILMARILGATGAPITQATISTIAYVVQNLTQATAAQASTSLTVSAVIFDTLQTTDDAWTVDSPTNLGSDGAAGYNLKFTVPASALSPTADKDKYQVDVLLTPASGQQFVLSFRFSLLKVYV